MIWIIQFLPFLYNFSLHILPWQKRYNLIFKFCICFFETSNTVSTLQVIWNKPPLGIITTTISFTLARFLNYLQLDLMISTYNGQYGLVIIIRPQGHKFEWWFIFHWAKTIVNEVFSRKFCQNNYTITIGKLSNKLA